LQFVAPPLHLTATAPLHGPLHHLEAESLLLLLGCLSRLGQLPWLPQQAWQQQQMLHACRYVTQGAMCCAAASAAAALCV
jgi:hypothetical protein